MSSTPQPDPSTDYYSVALIGSSGGGTATLGHTNPIELLTTIHNELMRIRDVDDESRTAVKPKPHRRRVCLGLSHAIFVSLCDGGGFDSIGEEGWNPNDDDIDRRCDVKKDRGPQAVLFTVGFSSNEPAQCVDMDEQFRVHLMKRGPLSKINALVQKLDNALASRIQCQHSMPMERSSQNYSIRAIISLSSKPSLHHSFLSAASQNVLPVAGSGGTSLGILASRYDLKIVGNSGGSVASTTLTKARGWARGLAVEWGMEYDVNYDSSVYSSKEDCENGVERNDGVNALPSLKSILEAALPSFLCVSVALRLLSLWFVGDASEEEGSCSNVLMQSQQSIRTLEYALRHFALGTACCVLSAMSRCKNDSATQSSGDQSTLLLAAVVAGVITSASASVSAHATVCGGGSALAGLVAGACIPPIMSRISDFCIRYHVTATMTNILLGGGVGIVVGIFMHLSGAAYALGIATGVIRCLMRWKRVAVSNGKGIQSPIHTILSALSYLQEYSSNIAKLPRIGFFYCSSFLLPTRVSTEFLPVPIGMGFLYGVLFVYGSKIGFYHSIFLPLILLEMDCSNDASLFGAIDECALVMVCAGICAGNLIVPPCSKEGRGGAGHNSLSWKALKTNILCGDFIEAAYPYMEKSKLINISSYIAAGLSCEILMQRRVLGSAYLPLPLVIWLSNDRLGICAASGIAFGVCFMSTVISNMYMW
ncbi:hypothetical protein HJC23_007520 [Cyclotella cryptica]|uniref:Uncharacterized protein n=1 Tax=Cyclotella cryptica TaxID=29204 RepID=A0ABD3PUF3_9STRA